MPRWIVKLADPMIAVLVIATLLALVLPLSGEAGEAAQTVSNVSIFLLFLVNGMRIARGEIFTAIANWRFFAPLVLFVFAGMSAMGTGFSHLAALYVTPEIALGFIFLGVLPSTIQSATSYTTLAGGNAALSVVGAALINILGVFISAPLFAFLAGSEAVNLGTDTIVRIGMILLLPFVIGQALQGFTREWLIDRKSQVVWLDRIVIGIAVYVAMSGAVSQGLLSSMSPEAAGWLTFVTIAFLMLAYGLAWKLSGIAEYLRADRIAFVFAGPQKSVAIGAPLAAILFEPAMAGFVIAPLLLYHLLQLAVAAPLATRLAQHPQN
ncbi:bile acid:sodium symporter [Erythrobacter crassostreae]|uniref:Bile acid:sodium symporter n=1 Tax=Erythrobacter crassostreae TaxID=2828328 RepID=A0A9X1JLA1_9SPHN|nr:bile acid:sodium symporter [Erythrobacter crassostrea]MBV7259841.1 bile acid:sodium symporter [Erythrobacter crassostrea]